jgi:hypothetical protein
MSDARWIEIERDAAAAAGHFARAAALNDLGGFEAPGLDGYRAQMAFLHAMQSGHTSLENCLLRILEMLGEEAPTGSNWHADLIQRVSAARPDARPAVLTGAVATAADETRRFRAVATRGYDNFDPGRSAPAVAAARVLAQELPGALTLFRNSLDS